MSNNPTPTVSEKLRAIDELMGHALSRAAVPSHGR